MKYADKRMALDLIEDALTDTDSPHGCGMATGLCGAFYMCGLLSEDEWKAFLMRIPAAQHIATGLPSRPPGRLLN
mgnify:CR=1 FL=1